MANQNAGSLGTLSTPLQGNDIVLVSRDGVNLNKAFVSDLQIQGSKNTIQNVTRANIIAALDFTAGNIVNVTDNLPTGITLLAEPTMPAGVKVGDRFELFFNKLQATQCTVQFPSTPSNLSYPFNNGTQAHIAFEWSGTRLVEV